MSHIHSGCTARVNHSRSISFQDILYNFFARGINDNLPTIFIKYRRVTRRVFSEPVTSKLHLLYTKNLAGQLKTIRSILEDSSILQFFFRFSLLTLCICRKVRD